MASLVVDSWAWVEYLRGSKAGKRVDDRISGGDELWTSVVSVTEVVSKYRSEGVPEALALEAISSLSRIGVPDGQDAVEAGRIHASVRAKSPNFGLTDSYVLCLARKVRGRVLTGDPDFHGLPEADMVDG